MPEDIIEFFVHFQSNRFAPPELFVEGEVDFGDDVAGVEFLRKSKGRGGSFVVSSALEFHAPFNQTARIVDAEQSGLNIKRLGIEQ